MTKYRKKPVIIEAVKWTGEKDDLPKMKDFMTYFEYAKGNIIIHTLEGRMYASPGDYIIKGVHGEFYPCKPDIFEETYEPVTDGGYMSKMNNDVFIEREGVFTKEKNNICNLPTIAKIEIHRSAETGKFYLNFIEWASKWNEGRWQDQEITEQTVRMILSFCYPEHVLECMSIDIT